MNWRVQHYRTGAVSALAVRRTPFAGSLIHNSFACLPDGECICFYWAQPFEHKIWQVTHAIRNFITIKSAVIWCKISFSSHTHSRPTPFYRFCICRLFAVTFARDIKKKVAEASEGERERKKSYVAKYRWTWAFRARKGHTNDTTRRRIKCVVWVYVMPFPIEFIEQKDILYRESHHIGHCKRQTRNMIY